MKTLAVLGGTGRTGVLLIKRALDRGYRVRALVRSPTKASQLLPAHESLQLVEGDISDVHKLTILMANTDALIDVIGPVKGSHADLRTRNAEAVFTAMRSNNVRRIIALSGAGVDVPGDRPTGISWVLAKVFSVAAPTPIVDGRTYFHALSATSFDWTFVRVPRLLDAKARGQTWSSAVIEKGFSTQISRDDVASFLLDTFERNTFLRQAPALSW
jgi:putative NADH-flavin reductase